MIVCGTTGGGGETQFERVGKWNHARSCGKVVVGDEFCRRITRTELNAERQLLIGRDGHIDSTIIIPRLRRAAAHPWDIYALGQGSSRGLVIVAVGIAVAGAVAGAANSNRVGDLARLEVSVVTSSRVFCGEVTPLINTDAHIGVGQPGNVAAAIGISQGAAGIAYLELSRGGNAVIEEKGDSVSPVTTPGGIFEADNDSIRRVEIRIVICIAELIIANASES